jgi:Flp pilus assembly pilin Flp
MNMRKLVNWTRNLRSDERGAEVTEVGIYLALIVAACVVLMAAIGPAVIAGWQAVATALGV